ncbi:hypothetical protein [Alienimonas chondri]|uniref:Uncharacterized protein n=1 Tax=Alienimonas chondri TaxID=2681879 RepID=A0ABX1VC79_9PLAN|nr:hypothetical protein [Alienimonas chondri]NNJ24923.1 hypothetical protein [Alienimonas chondri]
MSVLCAALLVVASPAAPVDEDAALIVTIPYPVTDLTNGDAESLGSLADDVVAALDRDAWATFGGRGRISLSHGPDALVVRQTAEHQREISAFLTKRRRALEAD